MSINLYQTGISGLLAAQKQLAVTGHNLANVNTKGYTRQSAEQLTTIGMNWGGNHYGTGTKIGDVSRIYNQLTYKEQIHAQNQASFNNKLSIQLGQLDQVVSYSAASISSSMNDFYSSLHGIAENPNDSSLRNIALTKAGQLAGDVKTLRENLNLFGKHTNSEMEQITGRVSQIAEEISKLNEKILQSTSASPSGQPNDLLDQRDRLVGELNEYVSVTTVADNNGVINVMIGEGTTIVSGTNALKLEVAPGDPDPLQTSFQLTSPHGSVSLPSNTLGGELGALTKFRDTTLKQASADLDLLSMAIADTFNKAQSEGLDLQGKQGLNLFNDINSKAMTQGRIVGSTNNTGIPGLSLEVNITDISQLSTDEYQVVYDASGDTYTVTNMTSGQSHVVAGADLGNSPLADTSGTPLNLGFELTNIVGNPPADNDKFVIRPLHNGAANLQVSLTSGEGLAAASPLSATPSENNVSDGKVEITNVINPELAQALAPMQVNVYESAPGEFTYEVIDSSGNAIPLPPPPTFNAGNTATITINDAGGNPVFDIEISGTPSGLGDKAPEQFTIGDAFGAGNGNNMLKMADTQDQKLVNGNGKSFGDLLHQSASQVGADAASAESVAKTSTILAEQASARHQSISGVNTDEEVANMLQFQKAYQAAAQVITVANTLFDTVLSSIR